MLYELVDTDHPDELQPVPADLELVPAGCLLDMLQMRLTHVARGRSRAEMQLGPQHLNQRGFVQGGVLSAFADAAAGWASYAALAEGRFTTVELRCSLVGRATSSEVLVAEVNPVRLGRRLLSLEADVRTGEQDGPGRLVARFGCTQLVLGE